MTATGSSPREIPFDGVRLRYVPYADSAPLSAKLLKNGTLKIYKGFPHGMPTPAANTINADLLASVRA
jgi:non-heme chloroperoxidase